MWHTNPTIKASVPLLPTCPLVTPLPQCRSIMAALPPLVLPPWLIEKDRYNINLPHFDALLAIADKGRRPRRVKCHIGPVPSGLYKTAQDTINWNVPKLAVPTPYDCDPTFLSSRICGANGRAIVCLFSRITHLHLTLRSGKLPQL